MALGSKLGYKRVHIGPISECPKPRRSLKKLPLPSGGPVNQRPQGRQPLQEEGSQEQQLVLQLGDIKLVYCSRTLR